MTRKYRKELKAEVFEKQQEEIFWESLKGPFQEFILLVKSAEFIEKFQKKYPQVFKPSKQQRIKKKLQDLLDQINPDETILLLYGLGSIEIFQFFRSFPLLNKTKKTHKNSTSSSSYTYACFYTFEVIQKFYGFKTWTWYNSLVVDEKKIQFQLVDYRFMSEIALAKNFYRPANAIARYCEVYNRDQNSINFLIEGIQSSSNDLEFQKKFIDFTKFFPSPNKSSKNFAKIKFHPYYFLNILKTGLIQLEENDKNRRLQNLPGEKKKSIKYLNVDNALLKFYQSTSIQQFLDQNCNCSLQLKEISKKLSSDPLYFFKLKKLANQKNKEMTKLLEEFNYFVNLYYNSHLSEFPQSSQNVIEKYSSSTTFKEDFITYHKVLLFFACNDFFNVHSHELSISKFSYFQLQEILLIYFSKLFLNKDEEMPKFLITLANKKLFNVLPIDFNKNEIIKNEAKSLFFFDFIFFIITKNHFPPPQTGDDFRLIMKEVSKNLTQKNRETDIFKSKFLGLPIYSFPVPEEIAKNKSLEFTDLSFIRKSFLIRCKSLKQNIYYYYSDGIVNNLIDLHLVISNFLSILKNSIFTICQGKIDDINIRFTMEGFLNALVTDTKNLGKDNNSPQSEHITYRTFYSSLQFKFQNVFNLSETAIYEIIKEEFQSRLHLSEKNKPYTRPGEYEEAENIGLNQYENLEAFNFLTNNLQINISNISFFTQPNPVIEKALKVSIAAGFQTLIFSSLNILISHGFNNISSRIYGDFNEAQENLSITEKINSIFKHKKDILALNKVSELIQFRKKSLSTNQQINPESTETIFPNNLHFPKKIQVKNAYKSFILQRKSNTNFRNMRE